jgi:hypothetical protein
MNSFVDIKKYLPKAIARYNMTREARAAHVCDRFRALAPSIMGEDAMKKITPKFFKGHTLYVSVPNSLWAQRLYVHRHDIIMKLNLDLGKEIVYELRTLVNG